MFPVSVVDKLVVGTDVIDGYLKLRGRVCDYGKDAIEVDFNVTAQDAVRLFTLKVGDSYEKIMTGIYTHAGYLMSFHEWERPFAVRTLLSVSRFNSLLDNALALRQALATTQTQNSKT